MQELYVVKIFQIPRGTKRRSLSLVKFKTSPAFMKMNSIANIYSEFSKIFRATNSRGCFCLNVSQEITVYWCHWFYFPARIIWHSNKWFFVEIFSEAWNQNTLHCLYEKKDTIPLYAQCQFIMYRLKIVTHVYMQLWVPDNLVLFIYHSGINCSIVYE